MAPARRCETELSVARARARARAWAVAARSVQRLPSVGTVAGWVLVPALIPLRGAGDVVAFESRTDGKRP